MPTTTNSNSCLAVHKMLVLGIANGLSIQGDSTNTSTTGWRSILNRPWREFRCRANMSHCPGLGGAGPDSLVVQYRWVFYRGLRNKASHSQSMHAMSRHDSSRRTSREKVCKFNSNNNNNNNNKAARWCRRVCVGQQVDEFYKRRDSSGRAHSWLSLNQLIEFDL